MFSFMRGRGLRLPGSSSTNTQDSALGLMHLRKLYVELCCTAQPLSQKEHEDKLYMMLPLFCKVFENSPATEMIDKFGDVLQFSNHIARLFVTEVRRRASDQSTEAASCAIASYLEIQNSEEASNGWMLLTTLSLLATGGASIVNTMTMAALPSTLVKCLYLFFDLPEIQAPTSTTSPDAETKEVEVKDGLQALTPSKRRDLLHRTVVQLLSRLCHFTQPAEELAKKDDLTLLFSAITSYCPPHNLPWRKGAAEVLTTISRHGLTQEVVEYIHNKNCLGLCVDNMQCNQELSPLEIVEMCFTVFCFLKDSSDKSHVLLDDFRTCQGYMFLTDFVLRLEAMSTEESLHSLRNLVLLISSLTSCGFQELRPSSIVYDAPFQQPNFSLPQPTGKGNSVRNLQAFQVLQTVFLKATTESLCRIVLDVLTSVYNSDVANYFILEPQNTLSQFIDRMTTKTPTIQIKILELVEFVVFNLNFVPYKELISISLLIKAGTCVECCIKSVNSLLRLVRHSAIYKDVFREVGLLEVMVTCLHRYATLLKDNQSENHGYTYSPKAEVHIPEDQQNLAFLVMEAFTLLLHDNNANATVFRESGGARCVHNLVPYIQCRQQALAIVQQLVLSKEGDDDMGTLLGVMQSSDIRAITLKIDILQSLVYVLRESSRSRTMFRKVGGFLNLISVLVSVEECLEDPIKEPWNSVPTDQIFGLIHVVFQTLTAAMRHEPANAKFFATEIQYERLTNAVRSLGCFSKATELTNYPENGRLSLNSTESGFSDLFNIKGELSAIPISLHSACKLLRCIYDVAIDAYGSKSAEMPIHSPAVSRHVHDAITPLPTSPPSPRHPFSAPTTPCSTAVSPVPGRTPRGSVGRLSGVGWGQGAPMPTHPTIVHPGAVLSLMDLLPSIDSICSDKIILALQTHLGDVIQDLVKSERNQQIMCEAGLPQRLLQIGSVALSNEGHPLHMPLQHMLERLASQALEPKDLRDFLRLGKPLNCYPLEGNGDQDTSEETSPTKSLDSQMSTTSISPQTPSTGNSNNHHQAVTAGSGATAQGHEVPLTRVKCLVSMTTPRDVRLATSSLTPAFVEFDMSAEGFGCLYLPSMAPQVSPAQSVVSVGMAGGGDGTISSGIGSGERLFPPQSGLSFCVWFCVDRYGTSETDMHPIRLITIVRSVGSGDNHLACFSVGITAHDRNLVISTSEDPFPKPGSVDASEITANHASVGIKLWIPELAQEGLWHHLAVTFNKAVMRHCSATVYVDGVQLPIKKMPYIQVNPGGSTPNPAGLTTVYAYVGTPPSLKAPSRLLWRLGPTHLFEETLQPVTVTALCQLGPTYVGSFQAPRQEELSQAKVDLNAIVIPEDKIVFGLHAHALSVLTVSKIRKAFNKVDSKAVAKQLNLSGHDNATPIRILHNSAGHLTGPGRSFGAVLMGELGVRTFCPKPVARTLANIGGAAPLLGLIAMATDVEGLYAAVKALVCVIKNNSPAIEEMQRTHGYQILAYLLKKKKHLLNSHILHLTFSLVGTIDSGRESTVIPHHTAFEDLLCDLEIWHNAPSELQRSLFEHFHELLTDSSEAEKNRRLLRQLQMVNKLLLLLQDSSLVSGTVKAIANVLGVLLQGVPHPPALLIFGQFLASTLPSVDEKNITPQELQEWSTCESEPSLKSWKDSDSMSEDSTALVSAHTVCLRNTLLETLLRILHYANSGSISVPTCDEVQRVLGFDWLLLFLQGHLHPTTAIIALRILIAMLNNQTTINKFREGTTGGGWLDQTEPVLHNRMKVVLGFNVGKSSKKPQTREINQEACLLPGFLMLPTLLPRHADVPEIYFLLIALALGHSPKPLPDNCQLDLNSMWQYIFGVPASQSASGALSTNLCPDAVMILLSQIRVMLNQPYDEEDEKASWLQEYPVTLVQFLLYLYHNVTEFKPTCMSAPFLCGLASTLFPYPTTHVDQMASIPEENSGMLDDMGDLASPLDDIQYLPDLDIPGLGLKIDNGTSQANLTCHPAKRYVMDFIRVIVVDSLSLPLPNRSPAVLDIILESSPERATPCQINEFQTAILANLMERLLAGDALLGKESALPIAQGGSYNNLVSNIFYFCSRLVDKLWLGVFSRKSKEVFEFIAQLIGQAKKRSHGIQLDNIYHCLNRTVLYQLSRPLESLADQVSLLESLRHITENRTLLFGPVNYESEFVGCLCHCLFILTNASNEGNALPSNLGEVRRNTTWHVNPMIEGNKKGQRKIEDENQQGSVREGQLLVRKAGRRVWEDLIMAKKSVIEEIFKVTLPNSSAGTRNTVTVDLKVARAAMGDAACKMWNNYLSVEKKLSSKEQAQTNQSRLASKVIGGLQMLPSLKSKRESATFRFSLNFMQEALMWTHTHVFIVRELMELQQKQHEQSQRHLMRFMKEKWEQLEFELMRERGLWGPPYGSYLDKWMLDMTEGPSRMRKKMIRNPDFYMDYPYRAENEMILNKPSKGRKAVSFDSKKFSQCKQTKNLLESAPGITPNEGSLSDLNMESDNNQEEMMDVDDTRPDVRASSIMTRQPSNRNNQDDDDDTPDNENPNDKPLEEQKTDNQMVLRLLEQGEKIRHIFRCARIQGLDTMEGLLLFCKDHFYIVDGFTLLSSREICDIDSVPDQHQDPIIPRASRGQRSSGKRMCSKFAYEEIREVLKRRYLLQPIAIEVFSSDGRNYLLAFPRKVRNKVYQRFNTEATRLTDDAVQSVALQSKRAQVEGGPNFLGSIIGMKSVTQRWERGEISNFQYLMALNTLAGRSYNDLMQYPIFPWILADYDSEELDLTDSRTFRDLSKPMGAQTWERLAQFRKRFEDWADLQACARPSCWVLDDTPPCYYSTHYSSAMIVASYLIRMEPFTQHFLRLQGGHFDLADRMFHSIKDSWLSASKHNTADVKELIPEFFYLPEFLTNHNHFDLGVKQSGVELGDIVLPPWAKGDPKEFIRLHREALECDYVSAHLHEWIDLIFGYKQQGREAEEAHNVFHYLFYEGNVDIYSIDDPLKKNAFIGVINNFGQVPKQLFKKPHLQKRVSNRVGDNAGNSIAISRLFFHNLDTLRPSLQPLKELKGAVGQIRQVDKSILAVEQNKTLIPPTYNRYLAFGYADYSLRIGSYDSDKATTVAEGNGCGEVLCAVCPNSKTLITGGSSTVVNVWQLEMGKERSKQMSLKQALYGHMGAVTCLAASTSYNIIVSGSRDQSCLMWDLIRLTFVRQMRALGAPVTAVCINELSGDIAICAGVYLYVWSINGDMIASVNTSTGREQQILCCAMSELVEWDTLNVVITGSSDGVVRMWSVEYVQVPDGSNGRGENGTLQNTMVDAKEKTLVGVDPSEDSPSEEDSQSFESVGSTPRRDNTDKSLTDSLSEDFRDTLSVNSNVSSGRSSPIVRDDREEKDGGASQRLKPPASLPVAPPRKRKLEKMGSSGSLLSNKEGAEDDRTQNQDIGDEKSREELSKQSSSDATSLSSSVGSTPTVPDGAGAVGDNVLGDVPMSPSKEYIMVTENDLKGFDEDELDKEERSAAHRNKLKPGFKWQRQLVFRSKLTMHTAFERKDNSQPAAVTAVAISRDHMKVFVGDDRGRVFSWSVVDQPGKAAADHWVKDESGDTCQACPTRFTLTERRHHCRNCGRLFCQKCSRYESDIPRLRINRPVRVCGVCYIQLKAPPPVMDGSSSKS
ncbi:WD repeat and FYVE domain-containing protein 3-like isoform X2 [Lytechinus pictus]|uniref:WD repeat and FYVE domain-containing protein 3-like isoform X2 n=1 Tax=Lytechinus pictus TaxID=7653 RepID=UPI0030BA0364